MKIYNQKTNFAPKRIRHHKLQNASVEISNYQKLQNKNNSSDKNQTSQTNQVVILKYENAEKSNLLEWCERLEIDLLSKYGKTAQFFSTDEYYEPQKPIDHETIYNKSNDPSKTLRDIRKNALIEYSKEVSSVKQSYSKIWGEIEMKMSKQSLDAVKSKSEYQDLKDNYKIVEYLRLIKQVHRSEPAVVNKEETLHDALTNYYSLTQGNEETLIDYKNRIKAAVERIETAEPSKKPTDRDIAMIFTRRLDPNRFRNLIQETAKDCQKYKLTLDEAHQQAACERRIYKGTLVPCETIFKDSNIAGVAAEFRLSKKEKNMILSIRAENDDQNNVKSSKKRKYGSDNESHPSHMINAINANNKKTYHENSDNDNKWCSICTMKNHNTNECRHLTKCQNLISNSKQSYKNTNAREGYIPKYQKLNDTASTRKVYYTNNSDMYDDWCDNKRRINSNHRFKNHSNDES